MDSIDLKLKEKAKREIEVLPDSFERRIDSVLNILPQKKHNNKALIAAAILIIFVISPLATVFARNSATAGNIIEFFKGLSRAQVGSDIEKYEKYSQNVGKTVVDNGISITIDNIACDDNFLVLFYTAQSDNYSVNKTLYEAGFVDYIMGDLRLNGKQLASNIELQGYFSEDGKLKGMIRQNIISKKLSDNLKIDFLVQDAFGKNGNWRFKLELSKEEAMKDSKIVDVSKEFNVKYPNSEHNIKIEKVSITPFGNQIVISEKFVDGKANPFNNFALYDEKGNVLDKLDTSITYSGREASNGFEFLKANKDIKSLTIVPIYTYSDTTPKEINYNPIVEINKFPLELKMSSKGSLIIETIEFGEDDTKIFYRKKGVVLYNPAFRILDKGNNDAFKDKVWVNRNNVVDNEKGLYVNIFPKLDKTKQYKLEYVTDEKFDLLEENKIVIDIK